MPQNTNADGLKIDFWTGIHVLLGKRICFALEYYSRYKWCAAASSSHSESLKEMGPNFELSGIICIL